MPEKRKFTRTRNVKRVTSEAHQTMKTFKSFNFALALAAAVTLAAPSGINSAFAAPAGSAANLKDVVTEQTTQVQRGRHWHGRHYHGRNRYVGPAIALGIFGAAAAAAAAQNNQYYYYNQPRQRCWVQTGPYQGQGYWGWC
jgi:hypothetical protein